MIEKSLNFAKAAADVVKAIALGEPILASKEEVQRRLSICDGCEKKNGNTCDECQCFLDMKTKFAIQQCPLEKWSLDEKAIEDEVSKMV